MKIVDLRGTVEKTNVQILWFFILYFPVFADLQVLDFISPYYYYYLYYNYY